MKRIIYMFLGFVATALGFLGVVLPVLPTTPFLLLAAFLFSNSSERIHKWLQGTRMYKAYVKPLKNDGGLSKKKKTQILCTTYAVMLISSIITRETHAIIFMAVVAVGLFWYIGFHIKTVNSDTKYEISRDDCIDDVKELIGSNDIAARISKMDDGGEID